MKSKKDSIQITELFMAKAGNDFNRYYYGTIKRLKNEDGSDYCYGKIMVNNGFICARGSNQDRLGRKLDEIVLLVVDYRLHDNRGKSLAFAGTEINLN